MSSNIDIKHLAHSLLTRQQNSVKAPAVAHVPELKKPPIAPHILHHAHEYVTKIMKLKGFL